MPRAKKKVVCHECKGDGFTLPSHAISWYVNAAFIGKRKERVAFSERTTSLTPAQQVKEITKWCDETGSSFIRSPVTPITCTMCNGVGKVLLADVLFNALTQVKHDA